MGFAYQAACTRCSQLYPQLDLEKQKNALLSAQVVNLREMIETYKKYRIADEKTLEVWEAYKKSTDNYVQGLEDRLRGL